MEKVTAREILKATQDGRAITVGLYASITNEWLQEKFGINLDTELEAKKSEKDR